MTTLLKKSAYNFSTNPYIPYKVPHGTEYLEFKCWGGGGGGGSFSRGKHPSAGGCGGFAYIKLPAKYGDQFYLNVGAGGIYGGWANGNAGTCALGGSVHNHRGQSVSGGGGGGSTVFVKTDAGYRLIACAGGGGGGGSHNSFSGGFGGGGGGLTGGGGGLGGGGGGGGLTGVGGGGTFGGAPGAPFGSIELDSLSKFSGHGAGVYDGGAGGGGFGGGGSGTYEGAGGGGGGYADPSAIDSKLVLGSTNSSGNSTDADYGAAAGYRGYGLSSNGYGGRIVVIAYGEKLPLDGGWSEWDPWSDCSKLCAGGQSVRRRTCSDPEPEWGGAVCVGDKIESKSCNEHECPIDWTPWGGWSECSKSCGGGTKERIRHCNDPESPYIKSNCPGVDIEVKSCNTDIPCPIHGGWSNWKDWGSCNVVCGGGTQTKTRTCDSPSPEYGGDDCVGPNTISDECNIIKCPGGYKITENMTDKTAQATDFTISSSKPSLGFDLTSIISLMFIIFVLICGVALSSRSFVSTPDYTTGAYRN